MINVDVDGASVLTGAYQLSPTGGPVWNTIEFECDYSTGTWEVFANGFSGTEVVKNPRDAKHRPCGLTEDSDGSLYVSDDVKGTVYRIVYNAK